MRLGVILTFEQGVTVMTTKDILAIAERIREVRSTQLSPNQLLVVNALIGSLGDLFWDCVDNFDDNDFFRACGYYD